MNSRSTMYSRMSWNRIKELFAGEWVELVDYDWDWNSAFPRSARVRRHASDRNELMAQPATGASSDAPVVLFVGAAAAVVNHESSLAAL